MLLLLLSHAYECMSEFLKTILVMHTCNPSTEEAGRRGSHKCEASLGLHNSTLSQKQNKNSSNFSIIESQF
jgi:hypothetical protein